MSALNPSEAMDTELYTVDDSYAALRNRVFTTTPESLGIHARDDQVWGVLMETGYPPAVVTLLALAEGTVSIYFSPGGGIIGAGEYPEPGRLRGELISEAQKYSSQAKTTKVFPLPEQSLTRFYFLKGGGEVVYAEANEDDLGKKRHVLSPLFYKGHELMAAIREIETQRAGSRPH